MHLLSLHQQYPGLTFLILPNTIQTFATTVDHINLHYNYWLHIISVSDYPNCEELFFTMIDVASRYTWAINDQYWTVESLLLKAFSMMLSNSFSESETIGKNY